MAAVGVEDLVVVATKDAVLVSHRDKAQDVKKIVEQLEASGRGQHIHHSVVHRPWGSYESVDAGDRFQVKRIIVKPGAKLSLQMHHHRAEHWVVVSGTALVTCDDRQFLLQENESTFIPVGAKHRLENPGKVTLHLIEVQSGGYLGEESFDIVRFEDTYGRAPQSPKRPFKQRYNWQYLVSGRRPNPPLKSCAFQTRGVSCPIPIAFIDLQAQRRRFGRAASARHSGAAGRRRPMDSGTTGCPI